VGKFFEKKGKDDGSFISIEKKISIRFGQVIMLCCIILGVVTSILSYISSISAVSETINDTSDVAANYVSASLKEFTAIAYETGSIARLADPERSVEEKAAILQQRIQDHNMEGGYLLDSSGIDMITGQDFSDRDYFKECMKGNTYISTPAYSEVTKKVSYAVAAPLWEGGIPGTKSVGAVVYIPNGEFLNDIMRSIKVGKGGTAFMLDNAGITIADVNSELVGVEDSIALGDTNPRLKKYSSICKKMVAGENGTGTYSYNGKTKVVAYSPVPGTNGWSIGVAAVRNEFLGKFYIALVFTIIFVVLFTIVGVKSGVKLGKAVATPLGKAVDRLKLLAEGDIHSEVPEPMVNDETAILLSCMSETISDLNLVISNINKDLAELADGNFMIDVDEDYKGDFSQISESFRGIISSLSKALRDIDTNAESVRNGATDLAGASQLLAEGATDQAASVEELLATVNDVTEQVDRNTKNAVSTSRKADDIGRQARTSSARIAEMTGAMKKINDASMEISNIIQTIEEIADQTNLLSLNASIEAARAGEVGRGFAVVAGEIGHLANQSSEAVVNTRQLIEAALSEVRSGNRIADDMAQALQHVIEGMSEIVSAVEEVAENSNEQNNSMQQINETIEIISEVVQTNSAAAEEGSATSQELSAQATELNDLIGKFQLSEN